MIFWWSHQGIESVNDIKKTSDNLIARLLLFQKLVNCRTLEAICYQRTAAQPVCFLLVSVMLGFERTFGRNSNIVSLFSSEFG
jgi:hypothetical protein